MDDLREANGVVLEDAPVPSSSSSSLLSSVGPEVWIRAEQATQDIIEQVQPTVISEERRKNVINYVRRLLKDNLGCEVFPFGSVPLKTYLPDGDIDLTAFCGFNLEENFSNDVYLALEREDHNPVAEFVVKDVQYIRAEVKLVKCLIQNIVVDISFNQMGGLCALCFLEEVDRLIGKNHLFKRSIILIKAWCYYESRILGAHHGLISTYALETLVLYIFHFFHSSLSGPLAVLCKFLEYFSRFDWDKYCVSLCGPVHVSSLPEIVVEMPENRQGDLLLSREFMSESVNNFSVPPRGNETNSRSFMQKHLNIVDPLKENNNLGRSVSKGNFFRIRSAFSYGARKLGQILSQPHENIAEEVRRFFTNTLDRHGQGQRPDVQDSLPMSYGNGFVLDWQPTGGVESFQAESFIHEVESLESYCQSGENRLGSEDTTTKRVIVSSVEDPGTYLEADVEQQRGIKNSFPISMDSATGSSKDVVSSSGNHHSGIENHVATCEIQDLRITSDADKFSPTVTEGNDLTSDYVSDSPHPYLSHQSVVNGKVENCGFDEYKPTDCSLNDKKMLAGGQQTCDTDGSFLSWELENRSNSCKDNDMLISVDDLGSWDIQSSKPGENHETPNHLLLADLSGDLESHISSLQYGRWWYDYDNFMTPPFQPVHLAPPPIFQRKNKWDAAVQPSMHFRHDMAPQLNVNGVAPRPAFFSMNNPSIVGGAGFCVDEIPKARGTGTYFPIMNHQSYRDRSLPAKGKTQGQLKSPRSTNGRADQSPRAQSPVPVRQAVGNPRCSDLYESSPRGKMFKETITNGFMHKPEKAGGEITTLETSLPENTINNRPPRSSSSPGLHSGESVFAGIGNNDRLAVQSYRLKDDEDFPPLST